MNVLIIGGYGTFGFRIAQGLCNEEGLSLFLAGRNLDKARAACSRLSGDTKFIPLELDRDHVSLNFKPDLIIDASGPFQNYIGSPVLVYCLEHGIDYADLSDNGQFVQDVKQADKAAIDANIRAVSGLSTCPVLSAIGLREIEANIGLLTHAMIGIAPSPKADLGRNVIGAVMSYAGQQSVPVRRKGKTEIVAGLTEIREATICAPGDMPLPFLPFAVADAPDAILLPNSFRDITDIWTGAATRPVWLHRCLVILARAISFGILPKMTKLAGFFYRARGLFRFGIHRGGMIVSGRNSNKAASWHLVAEGDHGPFVPTLPAVALVKHYLNNNIPAYGAYSGDEVIDLKDLKPELEKLSISYGLQYDGHDRPVYKAVLGDAYERLSPAIQDLHRTGAGRHFSGMCNVTRGRNPLSHIVAMIMGFPKSGENIAVSVTVKPDETGEHWTRDFGGKIFSSHHSQGTGRWSRHVTEKFGPIAIHMAILEEFGNLWIETTGWSIFGLALPRVLKPGGDVYETQDALGRFQFHVDLTTPFFGRLCKYEGWLIDAEGNN